MTIDPTWGRAIADYLEDQTASGFPKTTLYTRRQHLQHLARRTDQTPATLTATQLVHYAAAQPWARETRRGRRATFRSFWAWALEAGISDTDPSSGLKPVRPGEGDPRPVPDDVYLTALARADRDEAIWIDLAAEHGLRRAEIAHVRSSSIVDTLLGHDLIVHGKGDKRRTVPLTRSMARALLEVAAETDSAYLWPGEDDGHISPRWLGKRIARLLEGDWTIHKLRHRAATRFWIVSDGDPYAVADLMGWANLNMVRRYVKQPNDRLRAIVNAASRAHAPV